MKKATKSLIIAASVAAIAGIGAVSFAAWNAGTANTKTVTDNQLGAVSVLKFGDTETVAMTGLLPIDQGEGKTYGSAQFNIVKSNAYTHNNFKLKVEITKVGTFNSATRFYVGTSAPTAEAKGTEIDTTNGATLTIEIAEGNYTIYVCHDSADMDDMNQKFTLTYTLQDGETA